MAVWAKVVRPLAGREIGDVERFGDHEAEQWIEQGIIEEVDDPTVQEPVKPAPVAKKTAAPRKAAGK